MTTTRFLGGSVGAWTVERLEVVRGPSLEPTPRLSVVDTPDPLDATAAWTLRGVAGHERYTTRSERALLRPAEPALGRPSATCAALIPIGKSPAWWALAQDERRAIFADRSRHTQLGLQYLTRIARRLYHSRDLGEPFDFLTWFEYAPSDAAAFEELTDMLRHTEEWQFVDREIDIRLRRSDFSSL